MSENEYELEAQNLPPTIDEWAPLVGVDVPYIPEGVLPPDIEDPFANADEAYAKAEAKEGGEYADLPDGKYQGFVFVAKQFRIEKGKRAGYAGLNLQLKVIVGDHRGEKQSYMRNFHATDSDSMGYLKKDLATLGVQDVMTQHGIKLRELFNERLDIFLDRVVEFQVKRTASNEPGRPFINVYINRLLSIQIPPDLWDGTEGSPVAPSGGGTRF